MILSTLPFFFPTYYTLLKYHIINDIYREELLSKFYIYFSGCTFYILDEIYTKYFEPKSMPTITFMVPYIKFVNYPQDYNWFPDLFRPKPSPFIEIIRHKEIYNTWVGEVLINFKWNTYGKYYYALIWIGFTALLGCFTIVATLSQEQLTENERKDLLIAYNILRNI